mmetsp:Transcript_9243/g.41954  ORF Transcript_9243/g.41954 Transcript_9243/m.41954 type:complete len:299 (-) Transcript_9243:957-1853(-)
MCKQHAHVVDVVRRRAARSHRRRGDPLGLLPLRLPVHRIDRSLLPDFRDRRGNHPPRGFRRRGRDPLGPVGGDRLGRDPLGPARRRGRLSPRRRRRLRRRGSLRSRLRRLRRAPRPLLRGLDPPLGKHVRDVLGNLLGRERFAQLRLRERQRRAVPVAGAHHQLEPARGPRGVGDGGVVQTRDERHGGVRGGVVDGDGVGGAHGEDDAVGEVKVGSRLDGDGRIRRGLGRRAAVARDRVAARLLRAVDRRFGSRGGRFLLPGGRFLVTRPLRCGWLRRRGARRLHLGPLYANPSVQTR